MAVSRRWNWEINGRIVMKKKRCPTEGTEDTEGRGEAQGDGVYFVGGP
jgi:hypothetical protein